MNESLLSISGIVFGLFALCTIIGACGVAFARNIVYAAFSLLAAFVGVVGLFGYMSADFLAVVQLMVYVGGILVLILFAVMLTNRISTNVKRSNPSRNVFLGLLLFGSILTTLIWAIFSIQWSIRDPGPFTSTAEKIGNAFLSTHLLPFEVAGLLLLAALIAAVVVARKEIKEPSTEEKSKKIGLQQGEAS